MDFVASDIKNVMHSLLKRCVQCPTANPACPTCPAGQTCSLSIQSCDACASTSCVAIESVTPNGSSGSPQNDGPSVAGAIAGGVVGGIVAIVVITYIVWRFCIKKRRQEFDQNEWVDEGEVAEKSGDQFSQRRDARASTQTVGSIASTNYTRASNVIQIAYIPGVTNRSVESSPELIPPVPPIPAASMNISDTSSPHIPGQDQHFFMPRDSTYSANSDRSSVATTMYGNNAIVNPVAAQTVTRGKAVPVSLKSSGKNSPTSASRPTTPPIQSMPSMPSINSLSTKSSIIGRMATPRTVTVTRSPSNARASPLDPRVDALHELSEDEPAESPLMKMPERNASPQYSNDSSTFDDASSDEGEESTRAQQRSLMASNRRSDATTVIQDSPAPPQVAGSFKASSSSSGSRGHKHKKSSSLNQIIEEATRRATREPRHGLGSYKKDRGPFSDVHAAGTP